MSEKIKTPIDWFVEQMNKHGYIGTFCEQSEIERHKKTLDKIYEQAKEIEQQHIETAFNTGTYMNKSAKDYYKNRYDL